MKIEMMILLSSIFFFSCSQKTEKNTLDNSDEKIETVNRLYLFLDNIEDNFPENKIEGTKDYCLIFTKTDMNDTLFYFSYCTPDFPSQQEIDGYKGVVKSNDLNIMIIDKYDLGIELYKDSLHLEEIFDLTKYKSRIQGVIFGYLQNNIFYGVSATEILEKGWEEYFFEDRK